MGKKLTGAIEYGPERKMKVKCVDGSPLETLGALKAWILLRNSSIVHDFQFVTKQVVIPCDGILGCDFLQRNRA